jgi:hypothetical protein
MRSASSSHKPNTLPVLNCLFAALSSSSSNDYDDCETPYCDVAAPAVATNNNILEDDNNRLRKLGNSFTQDDLRLQQRTLHLQQHQSRQYHYQEGCDQKFGKSRSAQVIMANDIYAEVIDAAADGDGGGDIRGMTDRRTQRYSHLVLAACRKTAIERPLSQKIHLLLLHGPLRVLLALHF